VDRKVGKISKAKVTLPDGTEKKSIIYKDKKSMDKNREMFRDIERQLYKRASYINPKVRVFYKYLDRILDWMESKEKK
jgi:hypothetical protein